MSAVKPKPTVPLKFRTYVQASQNNRFYVEGTDFKDVTGVTVTLNKKYTYPAPFDLSLPGLLRIEFTPTHVTLTEDDKGGEFIGTSDMTISITYTGSPTSVDITDVGVIYE